MGAYESESLCKGGKEMSAESLRVKVIQVIVIESIVGYRKAVPHIHPQATSRSAHG